MYRIPLTRHGPDHPSLPHAAVVGGALRLETDTDALRFPMALMVDTGAATSVATKPELDRHGTLSDQAYASGRKGAARGVGGTWPLREFRGAATLTVAAEDPHLGQEVAVDLMLPSFSVLAPWKTRSGTEEMGPVPPHDPRRTEGRVVPCPEIPPLLGRDALHANGLDLTFSTRGASWLTLAEDEHR